MLNNIAYLKGLPKELAEIASFLSLDALRVGDSSYGKQGMRHDLRSFDGWMCIFSGCGISDLRVPRSRTAQVSLLASRHNTSVLTLR